jgi:hypothetical protein
MSSNRGGSAGDSSDGGVGFGDESVVPGAARLHPTLGNAMSKPAKTTTVGPRDAARVDSNMLEARYDLAPDRRAPVANHDTRIAI